MRYSSYAGCAGAWLNSQFGDHCAPQTERRLLCLQRDQDGLDHGRDEQHDHVRRAHPCDRAGRVQRHEDVAAGTGGPRATTAIRSAPRSSRSIPPRSCPTWTPTRRHAARRPCGLEHASGRGECRFLRRLGPVRQGDDLVAGKLSQTSPGNPSRDDSRDAPRSLDWSGYTAYYWVPNTTVQVRRLAAARHPQRRRSSSAPTVLILEPPEDSLAAPRSRARAPSSFDSSPPIGPTHVRHGHPRRSVVAGR